MTGFFTCIILIGTGITVFALLLMLYEKRRLHDYRSDLRNKKDELVTVIEDAEELISEMNRFADYVVTQIEEKHDLLTKSLTEADLKIELLNSYDKQEPVLEELVADKTPVYDEAAVLKIIEEGQPEKESSPALPRKGKVLTFDFKRREIIKLAKSGLDSTEIARLLNCGKGEIELIAKMGR